jgi:hypothetical protein
VQRSLITYQISDIGEISHLAADALINEFLFSKPGRQTFGVREQEFEEIPKHESCLSVVFIGGLFRFQSYLSRSLDEVILQCILRM